ncbi:MAG TPA: PTS transporter subunit EIIC [Pseudonocardiaceae bacterium]|jgi:PTS system N-acetylglucosamine-specific IIC component|nr:PTS transporter subunit EIIC [Pseudonocardiaceae bacterium]
MSTAEVTTPPTAERSAKRQNRGLAGLQRIGRSLMLPIATLPAAGLLLRLGQSDMLGRWHATAKIADVLAAAGGAVFNFLPLIFAVGVAIGFARRADGSTALAAVVGYVVFSQVIQVFAPLTSLEGFGATWYGNPSKWPYGVLAGIVVGILTGMLWQRFHRIKLPPYLAFFGGRRFVPIVTALTMTILGVIFGLLFPIFNRGLTNFGNFVTHNAVIGGGVYGIVNRLLLPFGLHNVVNSVVWFIFGTYHGQSGDINRFIVAHDPSAGTFMTGFFPIFMFALPAAALAIWRTAKPSQKKVVGGIMLSAALTAFLTGVTEPIEFSFMFVAWPLYIVHAVLTGSSLALVNWLGIHDGFNFSAGAIDYVLNYGIATKPLLLIPIGLVYAVIYYFVFTWVIKRWNLRTPGREEDVPDTAPEAATESAASEA